MRAIVLTEYGDPSVLTIADIPEPEIGPEDVLVDVVATALNRADLLQRRGYYPEPGPKREHEVPGMEFSGRVAAIGSRVSRWAVGDEVMAIVGGGAYAERRPGRAGWASPGRMGTRPRRCLGCGLDGRPDREGHGSVGDHHHFGGEGRGSASAGCRRGGRLRSG